MRTKLAWSHAVKFQFSAFIVIFWELETKTFLVYYFSFPKNETGSKFFKIFGKISVSTCLRNKFSLSSPSPTTSSHYPQLSPPAASHCRLSGELKDTACHYLQQHTKHISSFLFSKLFVYTKQNKNQKTIN